MSNSTLKTIATDIANAISAITYNGKLLSATVDFVPDFPLNKIKDRRIIVTPFGYGRNNLARDRSETEAKINVGICEKISLADVDDRLLLVETIIKSLERTILPTKKAVVLRSETDPIYDAELLRTTRIFIAICTFTVKVVADD